MKNLGNVKLQLKEIKSALFYYEQAEPIYKKILENDFANDFANLDHLNESVEFFWGVGDLLAKNQYKKEALHYYKIGLDQLSEWKNYVLGKKEWETSDDQWYNHAVNEIKIKMANVSEKDIKNH